MLKESAIPKNSKKPKMYSEKYLHVIGQILLVILKIILVIIGISFTIAGIAAIMAISSLFSSNIVCSRQIPGRCSMAFLSRNSSIVLPTRVHLHCSVLHFSLLLQSQSLHLYMEGIKLIFRFKANDKPVGLAGLVLWLLSLITVVTIMAYDGKGC